MPWMANERASSLRKWCWTVAAAQQSRTTDQNSTSSGWSFLSWMHQHPEEGGQISMVHQEQLSIPADRSPSHLFSPLENHRSSQAVRRFRTLWAALGFATTAIHPLHTCCTISSMPEPAPLPSERRHGNLQKIKGGKSPASLRELICRVCSKGSFHAQLSPHSFAKVSRAGLRSEKRQRSYQTIHLLSMSFLNCKNR